MYTVVLLLSIFEYTNFYFHFFLFFTKTKATSTVQAGINQSILNEDGLDIASLTKESREALAYTGVVVADTTTRAVTLLVTSSSSTVRGTLVGAVDSPTRFTSVCSTRVTLTTSTTVQRIVVRGALLERAVGTTETKVALASIVLVGVPSSVVGQVGITSEITLNSSGTSN